MKTKLTILLIIASMVVKADKPTKEQRKQYRLIKRKFRKAMRMNLDPRDRAMIIKGTKYEISLLRKELKGNDK